MKLSTLFLATTVAILPVPTFAQAVQGTSARAAGVPVPVAAALACVDSLVDVAGGGCLEASSTPTFGMLYPLGNELFVDALTGNVGLGTTAPEERLQLGGYFVGQDAYVDMRTLGGFGGTVFKQGIKMRSSNPFFGFNVEHDDILKGLNVLRYDLDFGAIGESALFVDRQNGNVGFGTTDPASKLDVAGDVRTTGSVAVNGAPLGQAELRADTTKQIAVHGVNGTAATGFGAGVYGIMNGAVTSGQYGAGVWGATLNSNFDAMVSEGDFVTTGAKSFANPHPLDPSKEIRFACLEGNESGTYFRGKTRLVGGLAVIDVPEDFRLVTEAEGLTVQLTKVGRGDVWVEAYDLERVLVEGDRDLEVHYVVQGVRRGFADFETIRENHLFRPTVRDRAFGVQYPAEVRRTLVENGLLNEDLTPNEDTAFALGWSLDDPLEVAPLSAER